MYSRDKTILLPLYKTLNSFQPLLVYVLEFWAPILSKDILEVEKGNKISKGGGGPKL